MKRRYVLFVPVAAVTLWLNGIGGTTSVNAAGIQSASQQPALVYQEAERDQNGQPTVVSPNKKKANVTTNTTKAKQHVQAVNDKNSKASQVHKTDKKTTTVDAATKEKRKQALAADYKTRQQTGEYTKQQVNQPKQQVNQPNKQDQKEQKDPKDQKAQKIQKVS